MVTPDRQQAPCHMEYGCLAHRFGNAADPREPRYGTDIPLVRGIPPTHAGCQIRVSA